jgi:thiol:disulfide interchange protein
MKRIMIAFLVAAATGLTALAQEKAAPLYRPDADAAEELNNAIERAHREGKNVLVQVGGNWCPWCIKLDKLFRSNDTIRTFIDTHYVFLLVNYSKENTNLPVLARLGYPQRFGFPVLVVLDGNGTRLHTQDSGFLEEGKTHSPEKVLTFLTKWTVSALDPKAYSE